MWALSIYRAGHQPGGLAAVPSPGLSRVGQHPHPAAQRWQGGWVTPQVRVAPPSRPGQGLTRPCGDVETPRWACPASRSTCSGYRAGSTGGPWGPCPLRSPAPGSFFLSVCLRGGGTWPPPLLLGMSQKTCFALSEDRKEKPSVQAVPDAAEEPALVQLGPGTAARPPACPPALSGCRLRTLRGSARTGTKCSDEFGGFSKG